MKKIYLQACQTTSTVQRGKLDSRATWQSCWSRGARQFALGCYTLYSRQTPPSPGHLCCTATTKLRVLILPFLNFK